MTYPSPGGNGDKMRGYLVQPAGNGPWPAVLVIHENRGLNPYIEDVARRAGGGRLPRARARWPDAARRLSRATTTTGARCRRSSTSRSCARTC